MISIDNFTVTVVSFPETVGVDWTGDNPTAILRLTPNQGFQINAVDFQATNPLPAYVASVTFTQDGSSILCTITYSKPSIMPAQDVFIDICASGFSRPVDNITVDGDIVYNTTGTAIPNPKLPNPQPYNGAGAFDQTNVVSNFVVSANQGTYFEVPPAVALSIGDISTYNINSTSTSDTNGNIIQYNYTVDYTYPQNDITGDEITVSARTIPINDPIISINAYQMDLSNVLPSGTSRSLNVYGVEGAAYDIQVTNLAGQTTGSFAGVMPASGIIGLSVVFPAVTANDEYTFVISGDLNPTFAQPTTWVIYQYIETTLTYELVTSNTNLTVGPPVVQAGQPDTFFPGQGISVPITIEVTYTQPITLTGTPVLDEDWTNQYQQDPPLAITDYDQYVLGTTLIEDVANNKVTFDALGYISYAGTPDLVSELNIDSYIQGNYQPISLDYSSVSATDSCCQGVTGSYFIQIGETFANAVAILDSSGNPAADGFYSQ